MFRQERGYEGEQFVFTTKPTPVGLRNAFISGRYKTNKQVSVEGSWDGLFKLIDCNYMDKGLGDRSHVDLSLKELILLCKMLNLDTDKAYQILDKPPYQQHKLIFQLLNQHKPYSNNFSFVVREIKSIIIDKVKKKGISKKNVLSYFTNSNCTGTERRFAMALKLDNLVGFKYLISFKLFRKMFESVVESFTNQMKKFYVQPKTKVIRRVLEKYMGMELSVEQCKKISIPTLPLHPANLRIALSGFYELRRSEY